MKEFLEKPDSAHVVRNPRNGRTFVIPRGLKIWEYGIKDLAEVTCVEPVAPESPERYYCRPAIDGRVAVELRDKVYTKRISGTSSCGTPGRRASRAWSLLTA